MDNEVEIYKILLDVRESQGRTEALLSSHVETFNKHVEDDKVVSAQVTQLQASYNQQRGMVRIGHVIWTVIVATVGVLAAIFGHH